MNKYLPIILLCSCVALFTSCDTSANKPKEYVLVWSDEFDNDILDLSKWNCEIGGAGWGNQEKQYYTNRVENVRVADGNLIIEARKEQFSTNNYTSARITTKNKAMFTYGKIEARIALPSGKGTWPAFWMLGGNNSLVGWPRCGEIDILEHVGSEPALVSHALHTKNRSTLTNNNWSSKSYINGIENIFHTYSIEWIEEADQGDDCIRFFVDGKETAYNFEAIHDDKDWPFNKDFFIILNLAIGGTWGGTIDDTIFENPVLMKVDYVRVYQLK